MELQHTLIVCIPASHNQLFSKKCIWRVAKKPHRDVPEVRANTWLGVVPSVTSQSAHFQTLCFSTGLLKSGTREFKDRMETDYPQETLVKGILHHSGPSVQVFR